MTKDAVFFETQKDFEDMRRQMEKFWREGFITRSEYDVEMSLLEQEEQRKLAGSKRKTLDRWDIEGKYGNRWVPVVSRYTRESIQELVYIFILNEERADREYRLVKRRERIMD